jgi:hypothetical protein
MPDQKPLRYIQHEAFLSVHTLGLTKRKRKIQEITGGNQHIPWIMQPVIYGVFSGYECQGQPHHVIDLVTWWTKQTTRREAKDYIKFEQYRRDFNNSKK